MTDDSHDLATRRGRPLSEVGALFPRGRLWHWIFGLSYAALVALELIGNDAWRTAATPYLDVALFVGLVPTLWIATRRSSQHEQNAQMRAATTALKSSPYGAELAAESGLTDEKGQIIDDAPPAWVDELTPEPQSTDWLQVVLRVVATPALAFATWIFLLLGLEAIDWARDHWMFVLPVIALIACPFVYAWLNVRRKAETPSTGKAKG